MVTSIDVEKQAERWARLGPLERIAAAEEQGEMARELVGYFAGMREAAIAEAHVQQVELGLSDWSVRRAVSPERARLQRALGQLVGEEATSEGSSQVSQALAPRARLRDVALALVERAEGLDDAGVSGEERSEIAAAVERARVLLGMGGAAGAAGSNAEGGGKS